LTVLSTVSCLISPVSFKTSAVAAATLALRGLTAAADGLCGAATCADEFDAPGGTRPVVNRNATSRAKLALGQPDLFLFDISNLSLL
jgi:hypothetical protein